MGRLNHDQRQLFYSFSLEEAILRRRCLGGTNCCNDRLGQDVESADSPYPNVSSLNEWIMREPRNLGFDRRKDSGNFRLRSLEVLG